MAVTAQSTNWDGLRMMRMSGRKPALPVIVTSNDKLPKRLEGVGAMVIVHHAGESMPFKLLDGLDVILVLDTCALGSKVFRAAMLKGVKFASLHAWCRCGGLLTVAPMDCESHSAAIDWMENGYAAR